MTETGKPKISIIGAGIIGTSLAFLLKQRGYEICGIASRTLLSAKKSASFTGCRIFKNPLEAAVDADAVFITTLDGEIEKVALLFDESGNIKEGQIFIHTSGALPSQILNAVKKHGAFVLSLHPLQSFAAVNEAVKNIPGSVFTIEGDEEAVPFGINVVNALGGTPVRIKSEAKPLYHAAACIASNYFVTLAHLSKEILKSIDFPEDLAISSLIPLLNGTLNNITNLGTPDALTGPIARGDARTIARHVKALETDHPGILELYKTTGLYTLELSREKGRISKESYDDLKKILAGDEDG